MDYYIGSTVNFNKRKNAHLRDLKNNVHHSIKLQRAYNKYGKKWFSVEILIECSKENRLNIEDLLLKKLKPKYNIALDAYSLMLGRKHKKSTKLKMSLAHKGNKGPLGFKHTEATKLKMSLVRTGLKRTKKFKNKQKENAIKLNLIRFTVEATKKKVNDSAGNQFNSLQEAAIFWNISVQTVCDILKGRHKKTRKGISFSYV